MTSDKSSKSKFICLKITANWKQFVSDVNTAIGHEVNKRLINDDTIRFFPKEIDEYCLIQRQFSDNN